VRLSFPTKKQVLKGTGWFAGAILVSAVANSFSDSLLKPALHSIARWVLDLASLGLTGYKNGVYMQIAVDNQSAVALLTLSWITGVSALTLGVVCGYTTGRLAGERNSLKELSEKPANAAPASKEGTLRQALEADLKSLRVRRWVVYVALSCMVILFVTHLVSLARISYVNSASTHYHHVMRIVSPYLEPHEQAQVESDFAQIGSREDYVRLLSRLEGQCKAHGRTVPKFDPW
jgi:hypothetical protein